MKKEFSIMPEKLQQLETYGFSWMDFLTAIPSPLFVATSYKSNGKPNACLTSWSTFVGDTSNFYCLMASVNKNGHLYQTLKDNKEIVLNFPSAEIYSKCLQTVKNNHFEDDEITESGLTLEKGITVNAPRIKECFLNLECEYAWEKELQEGSTSVVLCLTVKNIGMDSDYFDENLKGRYNQTGYLYNIHSPINPETGKREEDSLGILSKVNATSS